MPNRPLVSIVDDDESVRESLPDLLRVLGFAAQAFDWGRVSRIRLCRPDAVSAARCCDARHERTRSTGGT